MTHERAKSDAIEQANIAMKWMLGIIKGAIEPRSDVGPKIKAKLKHAIETHALLKELADEERKTQKAMGNEG